MARAARLAGAILAESREEYFLIGLTKEPCDFRAAGFEPPHTPAGAPWFVKLAVSGRERVVLPPPLLTFAIEGEALAHTLAERFVIERNGSVSERLWRLVLAGGDPDEDEDPSESVDARWLGEMPAPFWRIVRDTVLRCL
jgi:hypothetical protein